MKPKKIMTPAFSSSSFLLLSLFLQFILPLCTCVHSFFIMLSIMKFQFLILISSFHLILVHSLCRIQSFFFFTRGGLNVCIWFLLVLLLFVSIFFFVFFFASASFHFFILSLLYSLLLVHATSSFLFLLVPSRFFLLFKLFLFLFSFPNLPFTPFVLLSFFYFFCSPGLLSYWWLRPVPFFFAFFLIVSLSQSQPSNVLLSSF